MANSRAIVLDGGLQRTDEIRDQLVASWRSEEAEGRWSALWPRVLSLPLAIAFLVIAAGLHLIVRRGERAVFRPAEKLAPRGSWRSALLVGFAEVEDDRPLTGFFLILVLVTLFSLPRAAELGYRLPWIYGPGGGLASILAAAGLTMFVLAAAFSAHPGDSVMEPRGSQASRELVDVLLTLGRLRRTGILTVQGNQQIVGLTFLDGQIVGTDALNESLEEGLGAVLASRDLVSAEDFASMVAEYDAGGGRVTDLLIERSYVDREQLLDAQRWHCYLLCRQVLSWNDFEYKFYAGTEVAHEDGMRGLAVEELLVKAAEDLGPEGPLPGTMPAADAVFERSEADAAEVGRDELLIGLATDGDEGASDLLERIDGRLSVTDLAADVGLSEYEARLTFYLLERAGRVRVSDSGTGEFLPRAGRQAASRVAGARASVARSGPAGSRRARFLHRPGSGPTCRRSNGTPGRREFSVSAPFSCLSLWR